MAIFIDNYDARYVDKAGFEICLISLLNDIDNNFRETYLLLLKPFGDWEICNKYAIKYFRKKSERINDISKLINEFDTFIFSFKILMIPCNNIFLHSIDLKIA